MISTEVQVRFSDIDMLRHVNNIVLQQYYDLGKIDYFRNVVGMPAIWTEEAFIVVSTKVDFIEEVRMDDKIVVETSITKIGTKSLTFHQDMVDFTTRKVKSRNESVMVAFDLNQRVSMEIKPQWRQSIEEHEASKL